MLVLGVANALFFPCPWPRALFAVITGLAIVSDAQGPPLATFFSHHLPLTEGLRGGARNCTWDLLQAVQVLRTY